jgi:GT2 family glycosyltransferase
MFSIDDVLIVLVLYKEKLSSAAAFKKLSETNSNLSWFIYDNSPVIDIDAANYSSVTYVSDITNPGVSTAYNKAAAFAKKNGKRWLLLFDQDTEIPGDFVYLLQEHIYRQPISDLYAMRLINKGQLVSPCGYKYKRGYALPPLKIGEHSLKNITFLNSGLLVSVELFLKVGGYDVNVPLYFSDFIFINRLRNVTKTFTLLPIDLIHNLSSNDVSDRESFKKRYDYYLKGAFEAMKSDKNGRLYYYLTTALRAFKLTVALKNIYYIKKYFYVIMHKKAR